MGDGICDCCDGSDEKSSKGIECRNTCKEQNEEYRKEQQAKREKFLKVYIVHIIIGGGNKKVIRPRV